jgi:Fungal protein kinase
MLQCDISKGNLIMNEKDDNPSWRAFLIDLDLEKPTGPRKLTLKELYFANHCYSTDTISNFLIKAHSSNCS